MSYLVLPIWCKWKFYEVPFASNDRELSRCVFIAARQHKHDIGLGLPYLDVQRLDRWASFLAKSKKKQCSSDIRHGIKLVVIYKRYMTSFVKQRKSISHQTGLGAFSRWITCDQINNCPWEVTYQNRNMEWMAMSPTDRESDIECLCLIGFILFLSCAHDGFSLAFILMWLRRLSSFRKITNLILMGWLNKALSRQFPEWPNWVDLEK